MNMDNLLGEFVGTMVLIIFGGGVCANCSLTKSKGQGGGWICIAAGWGFAVLLGVYTSVALGAPQADLNPAVTLAKSFIGTYTAAQVIVTSLAQVAGAFCGAVVVWLAYLPHWAETEDQPTKLGVFCTAPAIRSAGANFLCEVIGTTMLVFLILAIFAKVNGPLPPAFGPYLVGILIWAIGLSLGGPTGYAINPASDFGPRLAHAVLPIAGKGGSDWSYAWVPILGPLAGGCVAYLIAAVIHLV